MEQEKIKFEDISNNFGKEIIIRYFNTLLKGYFMQIENYQKQNFYRFELTEIIDNRNNFNRNNNYRNNQNGDNRNNNYRNNQNGNRGNYQGQRDNNRGSFNRGNRPLDEKGIDKNIKNV